MFVVVYHYPVASENQAEFLEINTRAGVIYEKYGANSSQTLAAHPADDEYGCTPIASRIELQAGEELFLCIDTFRDLAHYHKAMRAIDGDPEIIALFQRFQNVVDLRRVVRGEFTIP